MKKNSLFGKTWVGIAALALLAVVGCSKGPENVAVVNGDAITQDEFASYMKVKPEVQIVLQNGQVTSARVAAT